MTVVLSQPAPITGWHCLTVTFVFPYKEPGCGVAWSHTEGSVQLLLFLATSFPVTHIRSQQKPTVLCWLIEAVGKLCFASPARSLFTCGPGATSRTCSIRLVLGSVCWQLASFYGVDTELIPDDYPGLVTFFKGLLKVAILRLRFLVYSFLLQPDNSKSCEHISMKFSLFPS